MTKSSLFLAVDVGASRTAAAIARSGPDGLVTPTSFPLGRHTDSVPSVVFVGDGELLFGDAAERRGFAQPERLVREFKRRIGDETPIRAGDRRFTPEQLFALLVSWVVDRVAEREGERPTALSVSIPAAWGDHRSGLVVGALARAGWRDVRLISEPEAAARHYAFERSLEPGSLLAVYDLGGGTFDAALVRIEDDRRIEIVGTRSASMRSGSGLRRCGVPARRPSGRSVARRSRARRGCPCRARLAPSPSRRGQGGALVRLRRRGPRLSGYRERDRQAHARGVRGDDRGRSRRDGRRRREPPGVRERDAGERRRDPADRRLVSHPSGRAAAVGALRSAGRGRRRPEGRHLAGRRAGRSPTPIVRPRSSTAIRSCCSTRRQTTVRGPTRTRCRSSSGRSLAARGAGGRPPSSQSPSGRSSSSSGSPSRPCRPPTHRAGGRPSPAARPRAHRRPIRRPRRLRRPSRSTPHRS